MAVAAPALGAKKSPKKKPARSQGWRIMVVVGM